MTGNAARPRLVCFRSHRHYEFQLVDDQKHRTLGSISTKSKACGAMKMPEKIAWIGPQIVTLCQKHHIKNLIFDRSGYAFSGNLAKVANRLKSQGITI